MTDTRLRENFREIFANFSRVSASFFNFFEVFGLLGSAWTCPDAFGYARMHLCAFGCIRTRSGNVGKIGRKISFFVILGAPGPPPALSPEHLCVARP